MLGAKKILLLPIIAILLVVITSNVPAFSDVGPGGEKKVLFYNPIIMDQFGSHIIGPVQVGQQILLVASMKNNQSNDQPFAYVLQIKNGDGVTVDPNWIIGTIVPGQTLNPALSWTPTFSGTYTAQLFLWQSIDNPVQLANPLTLTFKVEGGQHHTYEKLSINLSGTVNPPFRDHNARLLIFDPNDNLVQITHASVGADGKYSTNIIAGGPDFTQTGTYQVKVVYFGITQNGLSFNCTSLTPINCTAN